MPATPPSGAGGINIFSQTNMTDGQWHHFAVVRGDDEKLHLYIDGEWESSSEATAADFDDKPYHVVLGVNTEKAPRYFTGLMDEVRFWNYARKKEDINRDLNRQVESKSEGLVAYYDFNCTDAKPDVEKEPGTNFHFAPIVKEALKRPAPARSTND